MKPEKSLSYGLSSLLVFALYACAQQEDWSIINGQKVSEFIAYVAKPDTDDSTCIHDIARAKKDIANGRVVVSQYLSLGGGSLRYKDELVTLCKERGLFFQYEGLGCIEFEGQTDGCYTAYMNRHLMETYGNDFRKNLEKAADSLLLEKLTNGNKTIPSWDCDQSPKLVDENGEDVKLKPLIITDKRLTPYFNLEDSPFIDLHLNIDRAGNLQKVFFEEYSIYPKDMSRFKHLLLAKAREHLQSAKIYWLPAEIYTIPVNSEHVIRLPIKAN